MRDGRFTGPGAGLALLALASLASLAFTLLLGRWVLRASQGAAELLSSRSIAPRPVHGIPFATEINRAAVRHDLDPSLIAAVVAAESDFQATAVSSKGARGLMQLLPAAWQEVAPPHCPSQPCALRPDANLDAGSRYLRRMLDRFGQDVRLALAAYNAGPGAVLAYGGMPPYRETHGYVLRVAIAWWELRRTGTLRPLPRALLRSLDSLPFALAASTLAVYALAAAVTWQATRRP
ncbi:MAG: hypothetical protein C4303_03760 [candidate division GAL15 bacterium]